MSSGHSGSEADNNPFQRLETLSAPSLTSLGDRMEKFNGELYRDIKKKTVFWPKGRPSHSCRSSFDKVVFNEELALAGK